ncbi:anosmin-1 [Pectinophora gossypiella]|uniref:anosmin-1 n=1 Tax=Pectinophora gossypiella TaxID=13191 RepID=UPI00214E5C26|nr:anosmin-1 [Pectinophora gossypiella]XP_049871010.1 anosmin-1 [Pectinophora gossypiella]XP_049871011.1 anosmin-1 [Pectinophora gossypiella]XP_049871012.1 anosmin-1 [Pectinophora gossypiella]
MTVKMYSKVVLFLVVVLVAPSVLGISKKLARLQSDPLSKTRCDLMCHDVRHEEKAQCRSQCRQKQLKPGTCPVADSPKWEAACVRACDADYQCDGTQRCCHHRCGSTCSEPTDLLTLAGLPPMPVLEEAKEKRRSVMVRWSNGVGDAARTVPGKILYLLQEQHHLGPKYEEARLGSWNLLLRTNKTKISLRNLLKPGRWYRFRVAAVSVAGTRGFSQPGPPFTPRKGPRPPPPPKKLRVRPIQAENGTITVRLEWREPRSDLPVMRYKVYWSRRVRGLGGELDSVLVNHQTVPKEKHHIDIRDLQPNSMYFFQVQTISQFGLGKLRSDKSAIFYNTTSANDHVPEALQKRQKKITGLKLVTFVWSNHSINGRITWDPIGTKHKEKYYVHWQTINCDKNKNHKIDLSAITQKNVFDIYEIDFECRYLVNVNTSWKSKLKESDITVNVPSCKYMEEKMLKKPGMLGCKA